MQEREHRITFSIPLFEPLASHYYVRLVSEQWLHAEAFAELRLAGLRLPTMAKPHTDLLPLDPLPRSALGHPEFEALYKDRFTHFNPIQTQAFHTLYHTDESVLLGAPTGAVPLPLPAPVPPAPRTQRRSCAVRRRRVEPLCAIVVGGAPMHAQRAASGYVSTGTAGVRQPRDVMQRAVRRIVIQSSQP